MPETAVGEVQEKLIKTPDLAKILGVTPEYLTQLVKAGKIPAYQFAEKGHLFFQLSEVLAALRVESKMPEKEKEPVPEEDAVPE